MIFSITSLLFMGLLCLYAVLITDNNRLCNIYHCLKFLCLLEKNVRLKNKASQDFLQNSNNIPFKVKIPQHIQWFGFYLYCFTIFSLLVVWYDCLNMCPTTRELSLPVNTFTVSNALSRSRKLIFQTGNNKRTLHNEAKGDFKQN